MAASSDCVLATRPGAPRGRWGLPQGDYVQFAVEDDGAGMTPDMAARALEPFFTTKAIGKGTGLGLSMVQGFARQSGGDLRIDSTPGEGTTVMLWLPRAIADAPAMAAVDSPVRDNQAIRRVLVVDDEAAVRQTLSLFLTKAGTQRHRRRERAGSARPAPVRRGMRPAGDRPVDAGDERGGTDRGKRSGCARRCRSC